MLSKVSQEDIFNKTGFVPRKTKIYMTLNLTEKDKRDQFRKYLLVHEFKLQSTLIKRIKSDLMAAK